MFLLASLLLQRRATLKAVVMGRNSRVARYRAVNPGHAVGQRLDGAAGLHGDDLGAQWPRRPDFFRRQPVASSGSDQSLHPEAST